MKSFALAISLLLLTSAPASSQTDSTASEKTPEFIISGGLSIPSLPNPFHTFWKTGFNFGAGYGYSLPPGTIGYSTLYLRFEYNRFSFDQAGFLADRNYTISPVSVTGNATSIFTLAATYKGTLSTDRRAVAPFVLVGIGYMNVSSGAIDVTGPGYHAVRPKQTIGGFTWNTGVGLDIPVSDNVTAFVEGRFFIGLTSEPGRQYFPFGTGIRIRR